jgi:hypothetical protein
MSAGNPYGVARNYASRKWTFQEVAIPNGGSISSGFYLPFPLVGIWVPSTLLGTELTFQASMDDGVTYNDLHNEVGDEVALMLTAVGIVVGLLTVNYELQNFTWLKLRTGTSESPTNQTSAQTLYLGTLVPP